MPAEATLHSLLVEEMRDLYHAERQLVRALPKLAKAASSPNLRQALESHLGETEQQVSRLEQAFETLGETPRAKTCPGMMGIVEEGSELIKENGKGPALDAGIIAGAQRAEHYEIAAYGTVMAWAKALGHDEIAQLLSTTLEEEKNADHKLSELAEAGINEAATTGDDDDVEEMEDVDNGDAPPSRAASANARARQGRSSTSSGRARAGNGNGRSRSASSRRSR
jgi:ferritin-like metal-binding protein YciE